ncbi:MAG: DNA adenine methylase [Phycisphaerales bacterium]|nr:MAG: DNA adenine methylase [Phycisphaerales bacterium]
MISARASRAVKLKRDRFPRTRYQGSKRKLASTIVECVGDLDFTTVLDAFGGTGSVAYAFKRAGKQVTYNDVLSFNHQIGLALIENDSVALDDAEVEAVGRRQTGGTYADFIEQTFQGVYFTSEENRWLDVAVANIARMGSRYKKAIAWFALFQSAMAKRPYNLFHRKNLYMRTADVTRSFGNKASWDRSFAEHFAVFAAEANAALIDSGGKCRAICTDVLFVEPEYDLVYIDTPYINHAGVGVDYRDFYHFLEGMVHYPTWPDMVDRRSKHRRLQRQEYPWSNARTCWEMFRKVFEHFRRSVLVVSYRSDGIPGIDELEVMLRAVKPRVRVVDGDRYQYALSKNRRTREVLLIGTDD